VIIRRLLTFDGVCSSRAGGGGRRRRQEEEAGGGGRRRRQEEEAGGGGEGSCPMPSASKLQQAMTRGSRSSGKLLLESSSKSLLAASGGKKLKTNSEIQYSLRVVGLLLVPGTRELVPVRNCQYLVLALVLNS
jgi:hypothetical protein